MKRLTKLLIIVVICGLGWFGLSRYRSSWKACKRREAQLESRVEQIKRDADGSLKAGAKKNEVVRFFAKNNIPVTFTPMANEFFAVGQIYTTGCAPSFACGDSALIGVRVEVDSEGTMKSKPVVIAMYTDCL